MNSSRLILNLIIVVFVAMFIGCGGKSPETPTLPSKELTKQPNAGTKLPPPKKNNPGTKLPPPKKDSPDSAPSSPAKNPTKEPASDASVFTLTAREFYDAYTADQDATIKKYRNAWIHITGKVNEFTVFKRDSGDHLLRVMLIAEKEGALASTDFVRCYFKDGYQPWKKVSTGGTVTFRGVLADGDSFFDRGFIDQCTVIEASGNPITELTANDLAKAYLHDREAANKKYNGKSLVVTGTIAANNVDETFDFNKVQTVLAGENELRIPLHYTFGEKSQFASLEPEQEIKVIGKCEVHDDADGVFKIGLLFCSRLDLLD